MTRYHQQRCSFRTSHSQPSTPPSTSRRTHVHSHACAHTRTETHACARSRAKAPLSRRSAERAPSVSGSLWLTRTRRGSAFYFSSVIRQAPSSFEDKVQMPGLEAESSPFKSTRSELHLRKPQIKSAPRKPARSSHGHCSDLENLQSSCRRGGWLRRASPRPSHLPHRRPDGPSRVSAGRVAIQTQGQTWDLWNPKTARAPFSLLWVSHKNIQLLSRV